MKYTLKDTLGNPIAFNLEYDGLTLGQTIVCQDDEATVVHVGTDCPDAQYITIKFWDGEKCVLVEAHEGVKYYPLDAPIAKVAESKPEKFTIVSVKPTLQSPLGDYQLIINGLFFGYYRVFRNWCGEIGCMRISEIDLT